MHRRRILAILVLALPAACDRAAPPPAALSDQGLTTMAQSVEPAVERAVGLKFKTPPRLAIRSKDQVSQYLEHKLESDLPPKELAGVTAAYRLFGLFPDTLDVHKLLLALYSEQVAGYYDPDSATLYVVQGSDPTQVRLVLAHELVHALQGQYVRLDSLLALHGDNDRRTAAQAVMEGQATLASMIALLPAGQDLNDVPSFRESRDAIRTETQRMPVFSTAPRILREGLVFPYFDGGDFVRWFMKTHRDTVPFGPRLPRSTEQILHPDRYQAGDAPVSLHIATGSAEILWQDNLGEFESGILLTELTGSESTGAASVAGWAGDRYVVLKTPDGDVLVWWSVWDTPQAAARFEGVLAPSWRARERTGRQGVFGQSVIGGHAGVRLVDAPVSWPGWSRALPSATIVQH